MFESGVLRVSTARNITLARIFPMSLQQIIVMSDLAAITVTTTLVYKERRTVIDEYSLALGGGIGIGIGRWVSHNG